MMQERTTSSLRDGPVLWARNVYRLTNSNGAVTALQERDGIIYVCVRKGEDIRWVPFQKIMRESQLQEWIKTGGFPKTHR